MFKYRICLWTVVTALIAAANSNAQVPEPVPQAQPGIVGTWTARAVNPTCGWAADFRVSLRADGTFTMVSQGHGSYPFTWHTAAATVNGTYAFNQGLLKTSSQYGGELCKITWQGPNQFVSLNPQSSDFPYGLKFVRAGSATGVPISYFHVPGGTVAQVLASDANVSNNALALSRHIAANQNAISNGIMSSWALRQKTTSACVNRFCNEAIMGNQIYQGSNGQLYNLPNTYNQYHLNRWGDRAVPGYNPYANVNMTPYQGPYNPYYGR